MQIIEVSQQLLLIRIEGGYASAKAKFKFVMDRHVALKGRARIVEHVIYQRLLSTVPEYSVATISLEDHLAPIENRIEPRKFRVSQTVNRIGRAAIAVEKFYELSRDRRRGGAYSRRQ